MNLFTLVRKWPQLLIDREDLDNFGGLQASLHRGYVKVHIDSGVALLHTLILKAPVGYEVDHINRVKFDNRKENLRTVTRSQNNYNTKIRSDSKTGFKGVHYYKALDKFQAYLNLTRLGIKTRLNLGYFNTDIEAAIAYNKAATLYVGEHANLNVIPD